MKKVFPSKVDAWLVVVVIAIMTVGCALTVDVMPWLTILIYAAVTACVGALLFNIKYFVEGDRLAVRGAGLVNHTYDINKILSIRPSHSILSAPAASYDRLELKFQGKVCTYSLLVSPKQKAEFIAALLAVNPQIKILEK